MESRKEIAGQEFNAWNNYLEIRKNEISLLSEKNNDIK